MSNETPQSSGEKPDEAAEEPLYGEAVHENPDTAADLGEPVGEPETGEREAENSAHVESAPVEPVSATEREGEPVVTEHPVTEAYDHPDTGEQTWAPAPARQYQPAGPVYVPAPTPPRARSNRGGGTLIAILAAIVFGIVYLGVVAAIGAATTSAGDFVDAVSNFIVSPSFYIPLVFFAIALIILVQIVNRASWWVYIIGSFFVGAVVYFAFFGGALLSKHAWDMTQSEASDFVRTLWLNPYAFVAGILGNEVAIWMSGWLAARGRRLKAKNADARADYDRQVAAGAQQQAGY